MSWLRGVSGRPSGRWLLLALAGAVVVLAGVVVSGLRSQAVRSGATVDRLLEVRRLTGDSDALAWQLVAQGWPNFTFSQQLRLDAGTIGRDLGVLARSHTPVHDLQVQFAGFEQDTATEQRLIAAKKLNAANLETLEGVDSIAQIMRAGVERLRVVYAAQAATANSRLYWGTLGALGASALLGALLAAAFVVGRRRALVAERSALARGERRFRALLQKASDAVFVVNGERRLSYATGGVLNMFATTPQALVGRTLEELVPVEERARARQLFERAIRSGSERTPS